MAEIIEMPKLSDTMTEGVLVSWQVKVGDKIKSGQLLAEIETDKATMELESYFDGVVLYTAPKGSTVPVGSLIAVVGQAGENIDAILQKTTSSTTASAKSPETKTETTSKTVSTLTTSVPAATNTSVADTNGRVKASPLAKALANEKGVDIQKIQGSGEGGRIVKRDIDKLATQPSTKTPSFTPAFSGSAYEEVPISQMRKTIARRLSDSKFTAPHFYLTMSILMDEAVKCRKAINEEAEVKISFNDMVIKAVAAALRKNPKVNASWLGDKIRYNNLVNIGVAVAIEDGLIVPVLRNADTKGLAQISYEVKEMASKAKNKQLQPADWEGNTFTISNLGMFGIDEFTAIINPPDACILAIGAIQEQPVVKNGQVVAGNVLKVTLSCDHRVVDGATGSEFLSPLKYYLENPVRLLL